MALATRLKEGSGATVKVLYPGYHGWLVTAQKSRYNQFPLVANGWGTKYPIPDMVSPLLAKEEGLPT
jgi:hypothetical protein